VSEEKPANLIGTLNESPLHADLKSWYARPGDRLEVEVDGFIIDIVRGELLIEIQTANLSSLKKKLHTLAEDHRVRLVYPIPQDKWIIKLAEDGKSALSRRMSPKHGQMEDLFGELVRLPRLLSNANFSLDVLLTQEEEIRRYDGTRAWRRRGWVTHERRLLKVLDQKRFNTPAELGELLPPTLTEPFTTSDLAAAIARPRRLAQRMAYCLRKMNVIEAAGKEGNTILYTCGPKTS
jgi:hypothetical protein